MDLPRYHTCASPPTCRIYVHPFRNSFGLIDRRRLSRDTRLTSDSCSSGWCFVIGFLHRSRCLPRLAELLVLPLFGRTADFHRIDTRALPGAQTKTPVSFETGVLGMVSLTMSYFHWKYNQLSSAIRCFTVLFGMGRSGTTSLWSSGKGFAARAANSSLGQKQS